MESRKFPCAWRKLEILCSVSFPKLIYMHLFTELLIQSFARSPEQLACIFSYPFKILFNYIST